MSSVFLPVGVPVLSYGQPTCNQLVDLLDSRLIRREEFASHLPGVTCSLIENSKDHHDGSLQLETLFKGWLQSNPNATWRYILIALEKAKEDQLFLYVLQYLFATHPFSTRWIASARPSVRVTSTAKVLREKFTVLVRDMRSSFREQLRNGTIKSLLPVAQEVEKYLEIEGLSQFTSVDELFKELQPYCNYLNCDLIKHIMPMTTLKNAKKSNIIKYSQELRQFQNSSQLQLLIEPMKAPVSPSTRTMSKGTMKLSYEWNNQSLYNLMKAIEYFFGSRRVYISNILKDHKEKSLLRLKFFTPTKHVELLQSLADTNHQRLHLLGIMEVSVSGRKTVFAEQKTIELKDTCIRAAATGDYGLLLLLFELGVSLDYTNELGQTPLMIAIQERQHAAMKALVIAGADTTISDRNGYTAQMMASEGDQQIARGLNQALVIVNLKMKISTSPGFAQIKENETKLLALIKSHEQETRERHIATDKEPNATATLPADSQDQQMTIRNASQMETHEQETNVINATEQRTELAVMAATENQETNDTSIVTEQRTELAAMAARENQETNVTEQRAELVVMAATENQDKELRPKGQTSVLSQDDRSTAVEGGKVYYGILRESLADLSSLLSGNAQTIPQMANQLFSAGVIPEAVHESVLYAQVPPYERASQMFNSALTNLKNNAEPIRIFSDIVVSLEKVGLFAMATKLRIRCGMNKQSALTGTADSAKVDETDSAQSQKHVWELYLHEEVAERIETLHDEFTDLVVNVRQNFGAKIKEGILKLGVLTQRVGEYLHIPVKQLQANNIDDLIDACKPYYNFFNYSIIRYLIKKSLPAEDPLQVELANYIDNLKEFEELAQLKHIRSIISAVLPPPQLTKHTCAVEIKLNGRWGDMTKKNFNEVLEHYFGSDVFNLIRILPGSICFTFTMPKSQAQSLIDRVSSRTDSMYRIGIFELVINKKEILKESESIDFEQSLHLSAAQGHSFEVSMLLLLGADINSRDEQGRTALMLAQENDHSDVIKLLKDSGALDIYQETKSIEGVHSAKPLKTEEKRETKKKKDVSLWSLDVPIDQTQEECQKIISQTENFDRVRVSSESPDVVNLILLQVQKSKTRHLCIYDTSLTPRCVRHLSELLGSSKTLQELVLHHCTLTEKDIYALCLPLQHGTSTLACLSLRSTKLTPDGIWCLIDTLYDDRCKLQKLILDEKCKSDCQEHSNYDEIEDKLQFCNDL